MSRNHPYRLGNQKPGAGDQSSHEVRFRPQLEQLELRSCPALHVLGGFPGLAFGDTAGYEPPDTIAAAGPRHVIELVNTTIRICDRTGTRLTTEDLSRFFAPLGEVFQLSDPVVSYDELTRRFVVGVLDFGQFGFFSRFDVAISNTSDPTGGWNFRRYDMNDGVGGLWDFADYPRIGWNADAYVVSFNMFPNFPAQQQFDHVDILSIAKTSLVGYRDIVPGGTSNFTMAPATMHGAGPGDPMWLVEEDRPDIGRGIRLVQMTKVLDVKPIFTSFSIPVTPYDFPTSDKDMTAPQPGGSFTANDTRVLNAAARGGQLVASQAVLSGRDVHSRWYVFDTTGPVPTLSQSAEINQGTGISTYFPCIEIAANGDFGMTFMESSADEYVSMYITGRTSQDPPGVMEKPILVAAGQATYFGTRGGDYSGISVDPVTQTSFWAANEYVTPYLVASFGNWNTFISQFALLHPGVLQFSSAGYEVAENAGFAVVTVTRGSGSDGMVTVRYSTSDGTAAAGVKYEATSGTLSFADGQTRQSFLIPIINESSVEGKETVNLTLTDAASGASLGTTRTAALTIHDDDGSVNQRFVADVYWDLLGRAVDPGGLAAWSTLLDSGVSRSQVVTLIEASEEYRKMVVVDLYRQFLRRDPDPAGLSTWVGFLGQGSTAEQLEAMILGSPEYVSGRGGGTVTGFLQTLYHDVLRRDIDTTGLEAWSQAIANGTPPSAVALAVLQSRESDTDEVQSMYIRFLRRAADTLGLDTFVPALQQGTRNEDVIAAIIGSGEYLREL